ncbi:MAG: LysR family transcriptional regulator [Clostridia bacterium]|nr:LysR family transcriptional regulator [Clostridia bacterium]
MAVFSQYTLLLRAAELGSLTRAAKELGCTQSNISHAVAAAEREFGFPLLIRGRNGARLTAEGEKLLPYLKAVCESEQALLRRAEELRGLQAGQLRVGSFSSVAVNWMPQIIKRFRAQYPQITFELFNGDYQDVDTWLSSGQVDCAFTRLPSSLPCKFIPLYEDPLVAILPPDHPKAKRSSFPMADIEGETLISLLEGSDHDSIRTLRQAGLDPKPGYVTSDDYALIAMVENGLGISIVPELLLEGSTQTVARLPLEPPAARTIALAIPKESEASPAVGVFASFVCEWAKEYRVKKDRA